MVFLHARYARAAAAKSPPCGLTAASTPGSGSPPPSTPGCSMSSWRTRMTILTCWTSWTGTFCPSTIPMVTSGPESLTGYGGKRPPLIRVSSAKELTQIGILDFILERPRQAITVVQKFIVVPVPSARWRIEMWPTF